MPDMIEYASFGFAVLVWWTWPLLWGVVVSAVYVSYRLSARRERNLERARGLDVSPCLEHMGTDLAGGEHWCWLKDGHDGPHHNEWGVPQSDFDSDDYAPVPDPELIAPGKMMVTPDRELCSYGEDGDGNEAACWKWSGHDGPHMTLDQRPAAD